MSEEKDNTQQPSPEEQLANTIRMQIAQAFNTGLPVSYTHLTLPTTHCV